MKLRFVKWLLGALDFQVCLKKILCEFVRKKIYPIVLPFIYGYILSHFLSIRSKYLIFKLHVEIIRQTFLYNLLVITHRYLTSYLLQICFRVKNKMYKNVTAQKILKIKNTKTYKKAIFLNTKFIKFQLQTGNSIFWPRDMIVHFIEYHLYIIIP